MRLESGEIGVGGPGDEQGADFGADEVVRATGAEEGKVFRVGGVYKTEHIGSVGEVGDPTIFGADAAAEVGRDLDCERCAIGAGWDGFSSKASGAFGEAVVVDELADLIDEGDGVQIAFALSLAPGEKAMSAEDDAVAVRIVGDGLAHDEAELEAGAQPGNPDERVVELAIEFVHFGEAVARGRKRDAPVGMKVVDMRERQEAVQRSVNGRGDGIVTKGAQGIERNHAVFVVDTSIEGNEGEEFVLVESGKAGALDAAEVAA